MSLSLVHVIAFAVSLTREASLCHLMSGWPIQYARMAKYCSTWRNYADVQCNAMSKYNHFSCWESVSGIRDYWAGTIGHTFGDYERFLDVAGPGHWNDVRPKRSSLLCSACTSSQSDDAFVVAQADMLVIGNADHPFGGTPSSPACIGGAVGTTLSCGKLTLEEEETQMGLWSMFASPMMMSVREICVTLRAVPSRHSADRARAPLPAERSAARVQCIPGNPPEPW